MHGCDRGVITSYIYPGLYPNRLVEEWLITVEPGLRVELIPYAFQVEAESSCNFDRLEILDGDFDGSKRIGQVMASFPKVACMH